MTTAQNGAPVWLTPVYRYAGDDWQDENGNSLTYVVYAVQPVYAADGVTITTPGQPRNLTGWSGTGTLEYQTPVNQIEPASPTGLVTMTGAIVGEPTAGTISLSLTAAQTVFPRQSFALIKNGILDPLKALFIAQPRVLDASGKIVSVGRQPLFVF